MPRLDELARAIERGSEPASAKGGDALGRRPRERRGGPAGAHPAWNGAGASRKLERAGAEPEAGPRGGSWSRPGRPQPDGPREAGSRPSAQFFFFYLLFFISFTSWHLFLIREVLRARRLEDFAIPGVIPPTLAPEPAWDSKSNRVAWRVPNLMLLM
jgi:hypothetical protein